MPVLEQDYKTLGFNGLLEKENSLFNKFEDKRIVLQKNLFFKNTNKKDKSPVFAKPDVPAMVVENILANLNLPRKSHVEVREILRSIDPKLISGGNVKSDLDFTGNVKTSNIVIGTRQITVP
ncbi:MAG: hypothetical protein WD512_07870, partial [Candidatus Paceibacterota bacterium]